MKRHPFVGRVRELEVLQRALDADAARPVVFVHGPGGIGKSALLSAQAERAREQGLSVRSVDGRDSERAEEALIAAMAELAGDQTARSGAVLLLDTFEQAPALGSVLREGLPGFLEFGTRVVIAGRRPPGSEWEEDRWAELMLELPLAPLADDEARHLLESRGIDEGASARIAAWGEGHPLALTVAADAIVAGDVRDLADLDADQLLASTLVRRLGGDELDGADHDVLAVAAIARAVDARLLAAVIPEVDGDRADSWLRGLSFAEQLGTRVTLHARMRAAVSGALRAKDLLHDQELRVRIADHLYARIVLGEKRLFADLAELLTDPALRWAAAPERMTHRITTAQPGDRERIGELLGAIDEPWWEGTRRWFEEAPERIMVARDPSRNLSAWAIWVTPANAPPWADGDPVVGPWLADARVAQPDGDVVMVRDGGPLGPPAPAGTVAAGAVAGNFAVVLGSGLPSPRRWYAPARGDEGDQENVEFLRAAGYQPAPHLDAHDSGRVVRCYVVDHGPGGIFRAARDLVYLSLGRTPPAIDTAAEDPDSAGSVVRDALRSFHEPLALASSPLASGATAEERTLSVQASLRDATAAAFGASEEEQLQRAAIERGYLDPDGSHRQALTELEMSPAAYYRCLEAAADSIDSYLAATRGRPLAPVLQRSRERLVVAREEERRRLSRDLHDSLGPTLAGMAFSLDAARNLIDSDPEGASRIIGELREETQEAIGDIRRVANELRSPALDELGFVPALRTFAERLNAGEERLRVRVEAPEPFPELGAAAEVAAYRIVLEALTNVTRHANARDCCVELSAEGRELKIAVADDGVGLEADREGGLGLGSMRERAAELGGRMEITPRTGGGIRVAAVLPIGAEP